MKKMYFVLIGLLSLTVLFSQTVLTYENHALTPGDQHHFVIANNVEEGPKGAGQVWDFSRLEKSSELISEMHNTDAHVEGASMYINEFGNKFYFHVSETIVEEYGVVSCGDNTIQYEKPAVKMVFPFHYGDIYENDFHGHFMAGERKVTISGKDLHEADAYGTLILPGDVEISNVIRLKSTRTRMYESCNSNTTTTYRWYSENVRYPLLTIIKQERGEQSSYLRTAYYANAKQDYIENKEKQQKTKPTVESVVASMGGNTFIKTFPSPFDSYFDVLYRITERTNVVLDVFNNNGQKIYSIKMGIQEPGVYTHRIDDVDISLSTEMLYINVITDNEILNTKIIRAK